MPEEKVNVIAYSGYRGEETPKKFILHDKQIEAVDILSRWTFNEAKQRREV